MFAIILLCSYVRSMHIAIALHMHIFLNSYIRTYIHTYIHTYVRMYVHVVFKLYVHTYISTCSYVLPQGIKAAIYDYYGVTADPASHSELDGESKLCMKGT